MKTRIVKYFGLVLLSSLSLWGCQREPIGEEDKAPQSNLVRLKVDVEIPDFEEAATKTDFTETPTCSRLFVIVFDEADLHPVVTEADENEGSFTVSLQPSALPRILHFLALPSGSPLVNVLINDVNGKDIDEPTFATRLATQNGDAACWARKYLAAGISSSTDLTGIKMVRNYAKVFVEVGDDVHNFQLESFRVYNAAKYGMAIPFKGLGLDNSGRFESDFFPEFFDGNGQMRSYADVNGTQGYRGYPHLSGALRTPTTADAASYSTYLTPPDSYDYIFETRFNPEDGLYAPYILFKGKFDGNGNFGSAPSTWYKADFVYDPDPNASDEWGKHDLLPYDILRNYAYVLTIEGVIGEGAPTALEAAQGPSRNNFEGSVAGMDISGVQEVASAMYLSQTAIELSKNSNVTYIDLYYRNENISGNTRTEANTPGTDIRITVSGDEIISSSIINDGALDLSGAGTDHSQGNFVSASIPSSHASIEALHLKSGNWWHLRLPVSFDSDGRGTLQQTITFKNRAGLSRHCVISVRPLYPFEIIGYSENPNIVEMASTEINPGDDVVPVYFRIPSGMPEALFPLDFMVESYSSGNGPTGSTDVTRQVLQPNLYAIASYKAGLGSGDYRIDLPVSGNSATIVGATASDEEDLTFSSYHYTRTLTWTEYNNQSSDSENMKAFPVFLEPQYDPRDASTVSSLGATTVWMRQGDRANTYFSYRDDENVCTRRFNYIMKVVEPTEIVLPALEGADYVYDGKNVYVVTVNTERALTVSVRNSRSGDPAPNHITLSKGSAAEFSLTPSAGDGSVNATVHAYSSSGDRLLPVTASAATKSTADIDYGASNALFYIKTIKGTRNLSFPASDVTVLKNLTITSASGGTLKYVPALKASCPGYAGNIIYSLTNSDTPTTSNSYVEIVQTGGDYTLKGKLVNGAASVKVYAIIPEDDNYERAVAEINVSVVQGVITQDGGWWASDNGKVGIYDPVSSCNILYDNANQLYTPSSLSFTDASAGVTFTSSDPSIATVQKIDGDWTIVPRGEGSCTLTMNVRGTDDNGDGIYGDNGDVFAAASFNQTYTVSLLWWKVQNGMTGIADDEYAISNTADNSFITYTSSNYYDETVFLVGRDYRFYGITAQAYTPTSYNNGEGKYLESSAYSYVFTSSSGRYSLKASNSNNYLLPRLSMSRSSFFSGYANDADNSANYLALTVAAADASKGWVISGTGESISMQGYANANTGNYLRYYGSGANNVRFDSRGTDTDYVHLWRKCETIDEVSAATGFTYPPAP